MGIFDAFKKKDASKSSRKANGSALSADPQEFKDRLMREPSFMKEILRLLDVSATLNDVKSAVRGYGYDLSTAQILTAAGDANLFYQEQERKQEEAARMTPEEALAKKPQCRQPQNEAERFFYDMIGNPSHKAVFDAFTSDSANTVGMLLDGIQNLGYQPDVIHLMRVLKGLGFKANDALLLDFFKPDEDDA